jgi:ATP-dependent DNA ligase
MSLRFWAGQHEIKLDGYRMATRIDNGRAQLLTLLWLDWTAKYPGVIAALANLNVRTAYIEGELCGVDDAGLPSSAQTQAATDGARSAARLLRFRSLALGRFGRLETSAHRAQGAAQGAA